MDKATQWSKTANYIRNNPGATLRDIFNDCLINSPSKRISELVGAGVPITSVWDETTNAEGEKKRFKRYFLAK